MTDRPPHGTARPRANARNLDRRSKFKTGALVRPSAAVLRAWALPLLALGVPAPAHSTRPLGQPRVVRGSRGADRTTGGDVDRPELVRLRLVADTPRMEVSDEPWSEDASRIEVICRQMLSGLVGVYLHGSAALGGFTSASDLDVLVIADGPIPIAAVGQSLLGAVAGFPLELSIVTGAAAAAPAPPFPFVVHVASPDRVVADDGNGDADLMAHLAVCRVSGVALSGPPPAEVIGPVDRHRLLAYLAHELQWGLDHGDQRYAVLNACRAAAYAETGLLLSKVSGGQWWVEHHGPDAQVETALQAQLAGHDLGPGDVGTRRLVHHIVQRLVTATSRSL